MCVENDLRNGQTVSASIITTLRGLRCHTSLLVRKFLLNKNITVCPHPPYSPDLAPCDFWLFPKVKMTMKCKRFESIQDIEAGTKAQL